jgi:hypothetical protein
MLVICAPMPNGIYYRDGFFPTWAASQVPGGG